MKSSSKSLIPVAAVAAMAALLMAGCHQEKLEKDKAKAIERTEAAVYSTEEDTMAAYYERMQGWKALHGWTDRWESEK